MRNINSPLVEDLNIKLKDTKEAIKKAREEFRKHLYSDADRQTTILIGMSLTSLYKRRETLERRLKEATKCAT